MEEWKDIEGYNSTYQVSNLGNVRSLKFGKSKLLVLGLRGSGYLNVVLCKNGKRITHSVHRLVAEAFLPNPNNLPQVNHKDENKQNNCVDNLEWCTAGYNINYGTRTERIKQNRTNKQGIKHHNSKPINQYTKDGELVKRWECARDIEKEIGVSHTNISDCANGKQKTAKGFIWRFAS